MDIDIKLKKPYEIKTEDVDQMRYSADVLSNEVPFQSTYIKEEKDDVYTVEELSFVAIKNEPVDSEADDFGENPELRFKSEVGDKFVELNNNIVNKYYVKEDAVIKTENLLDYKSLGTNEVIIKSEESDRSKRVPKISGKRVWACKRCDYTSKTQRSLQLHAQAHGDLNTSLFCDRCPYNPPDKLQLERHKQIHKHVDDFGDFTCNRETFESKKPPPSRKKDRSLKCCHLCDYRTRQSGHLTRHLLVHKSPEDVVMYRCHDCTFSSKQKCRLRLHIKAVHLNRLTKGLDPRNRSIFRNLAQVKEYTCTECPYKTVRSSDIKRHLVTHEGPDEATMFTCEQCNFKTKYKRNLAVHVSTHKDAENLRTYECSKCSFKTKLRYNLKRHLLSKRHLGLARAPRGSATGCLLEDT
ncbi:zinc finger protein 711-like [Cylas formicarius]|uniref:zinc finger protein 711-like n=1 Tax=Cylas formicarius TaxID=197179 RepID=UPI002958549C|nr:zinc finger protein 711-like [Cylas formicarius]